MRQIFNMTLSCFFNRSLHVSIWEHHLTVLLFFRPNAGSGLHLCLQDVWSVTRCGCEWVCVRGKYVALKGVIKSILYFLAQLHLKFQQQSKSYHFDDQSGCIFFISYKKGFIFCKEFLQSECCWYLFPPQSGLCSTSSFRTRVSVSGSPGSGVLCRSRSWKSGEHEVENCSA